MSADRRRVDDQRRQHDPGGHRDERLLLGERRGDRERQRQGDAAAQPAPDDDQLVVDADRGDPRKPVDQPASRGRSPAAARSATAPTPIAISVRLSVIRSASITRPISRKSRPLATKPIDSQTACQVCDLGLGISVREKAAEHQSGARRGHHPAEAEDLLAERERAVGDGDRQRRRGQASEPGGDLGVAEAEQRAERRRRRRRREKSATPASTPTSSVPSAATRRMLKSTIAIAVVEQALALDEHEQAVAGRRAARKVAVTATGSVAEISAPKTSARVSEIPRPTWTISPTQHGGDHQRDDRQGQDRDEVLGRRPGRQRQRRLEDEDRQEGEEQDVVERLRPRPAGRRRSARASSPATKPTMTRIRVERDPQPGA